MQPLYEDVLRYEVVIKHFISTGKEKWSDERETPEGDALANLIADIERRWNDVSRKVITRHDCIKRLLPLSRVYSEYFEKLLAWMSNADDDLKAVLPISSDQESLVQQKRVVEVSYSCIFIIQ